MRRRGVGIVGVAAVAHHAANKGAQQQAAADQAAMQQAAPVYEAPAAPAAPASDPVTDQLTNLANLHASGILTDEEFAAAKAKVIGI